MSQDEAKNQQDQQEIITDEAELDEEALDQVAGGAQNPVNAAVKLVETKLKESFSQKGLDALKSWF